MKTPDQILQLFEVRRNDPSEKWRMEALMVKRLMNGEVFAPVSERFGDYESAVVANLAQQNLNQLVKRIVSTTPNVTFKSVRPGFSASDGKARQRRQAALGFWEQNEIAIQDRKRMRWLQGYGVGPVQITVHEKLPAPKWVLRDPLMTYPGPCDELTGYQPRDCIFAYKRSYRWLKDYYSAAAFEVASRSSRSTQSSLNDDTLFELVEYIDETERVIVLAHKDFTNGNSYTDTLNKTSMPIELARIENRLGTCPIVAPSTISIDRIKSQYHANVGIEYMRNKLAALEYLFAEKSVFPETYFVEPPNSPNGEIVQLADGESGQIGHLRGGSIENVAMQPNFAGAQMSSRLEQEERTQNSTPAEFGGESASNIRTGIRGNNIMSAAIDYTIQEAQEIYAVAKRQELRIAIKVDKTYCNRPKAYNVGWEGNPATHVDYDPKLIWEDDRMTVSYGAAGSDLQSLVISGGQRIAQQTMSRETFMGIDPLVDDVQQERDRIEAEMLKQAGFTQLLQPGALDPVAIARVAELVQSGKKEWWDALQQVHEERQQSQATDGQPGEPNAPAEPNSPEAQPGLAPGAASGVSGPSPDQQNLMSVLGALRRPQMTVNGS